MFRLAQWLFIVVALGPCVMCAGALIVACIRTLVFGAANLKAGATRSRYNVYTNPRMDQNPTVENGTLGSESQTQIQEFFTQKRRK